MSGMAETGRCVATNPAGARCILGATHGNVDHLWASDSYLLGMLQSVVAAYLAGECDRDLLAQTLAETGGER